MKIAVFLPNSFFVKNVDRQIMSTVALAFNQSFSPELEIETIGFAGSVTEIQKALQKVILSKNPIAVISVLGCTAMRDIAETCSRFKTPFLAINAGGDIVKVADANPYLFVNSFNLYESAWYLGQWASQNVSKTGASVSAFHEAGYEMSMAFEDGFRSGGGVMKQVATTHKESREESSTPVLTHILDMEPGLIMSFHSSKEAIGFSKDYYGMARYDNVPLLGALPMFDVDTLDALDHGVAGMPFASSWIPDMQNEENVYFRKLYDDIGIEPPSLFAVVAWEAINLVKNAWTLHREKSITVRDALLQVEFKGPRGTIRYSPKTQEALGYGQNLCRVVKSGDRLALKVEKPLLVNPRFLAFKAERQKEDTAGWSNPYLIG